MAIETTTKTMVALQHKFSNELKQELYRMELRFRAQNANASLQAFATEAEISAAHKLRREPPVDR